MSNKEIWMDLESQTAGLSPRELFENGYMWAAEDDLDDLQIVSGPENFA